MRRLEFHPHADADISRIIDYYEAAEDAVLADEFYSELRMFLKRAANSPERYAIRKRDIRRVNLERFPFLYRIVDDRVRILAVRHNRRRPSLGLQRR
jgi:plasmid stabilization system protein ParE